jgi:hypothetical protein
VDDGIAIYSPFTGFWSNEVQAIGDYIAWWGGREARWSFLWQLIAISCATQQSKGERKRAPSVSLFYLPVSLLCHNNDDQLN